MTESDIDAGEAGFEQAFKGRSIREVLGDRPLDQPIELLVQLAEDGEIDPWDIDLITVTDAFLSRIDESDLVVTARTLFFASVLLRLKSDAIVAPEAPPDEPAEEIPYPVEGNGDPVAALEQEMDRRLTRKAARGTPTTLADLIRELRQAERDRYWKDSRTYDTSGVRRQGPRTVEYHEYTGTDGLGDAIGKVSETPHRENIEGAIEAVAEVLRDVFARGDTITYAKLDIAELSPARTYQALVFLEHREAITLHQPTMYETLTVRPGPKGLDSLSSSQ